jgi:hypothetical protein
LLGGFGAVDLSVVKLRQDVLEKRAGQAFGQLFFSQPSMYPARPLVQGLRRPALRSTLSKSVERSVPGHCE